MVERTLLDARGRLKPLPAILAAVLLLVVIGALADGLTR
jgi:hypothetical protein